MGDFSVNKLSDLDQRKLFTKQLINDIHALEIMHNENLFEEDVCRIGAEQELVLVGKDFRPSLKAVEILKRINDEHYTTELALFNLEANLDPQEFTGNCFSRMEKQLITLLKKGKKAALKEDTSLLLTGILPTIQRKELVFDCLTPNPRYHELNNIIRQQRGADFELNISGLDEFVTKSDTILFEACNTSFQIHLQVNHREFQPLYNWAQAIAGPVLAVTANSPVLFAKRLWSETRIALFQQSIDTRNAAHVKRDSEPRVSFGRGWLHGNVADLFKDNVSRYNMWFGTEDNEDSLELLKQGKIPKLNALRMHNGTVYKWNRPCYGLSPGNIPHLRIENRYIPSGPTVLDEMANAAFWLGLMHGMPEEYKDLPNMMKFEDMRLNFYNASRTCLDASFKWMGKRYDAVRLIKHEFLPLAYEGLNRAKVNKKDTNRLLGVIEERLNRDINGAKWTTRNFTHFLEQGHPNEAAVAITKKLIENEEKGLPVHLWEDVQPMEVRRKEFNEVYQAMETDLVTVKDHDLLEFVVNVMDWRKIRHIPVENDEHELVGLITSRNMIHYFRNLSQAKHQYASDIMKTELVTVSPHTKTKEAVRLMAEKKIGCLPVVQDGKLVGLITERDIVKVVNETYHVEG